jgi:hypothetical protein
MATQAVKSSVTSTQEFLPNGSLPEVRQVGAERFDDKGATPVDTVHALRVGFLLVAARAPAYPCEAAQPIQTARSIQPAQTLQIVRAFRNAGFGTLREVRVKPRASVRPTRPCH